VQFDKNFKSQIDLLCDSFILVCLISSPINNFERFT
jgi:hypothetical protein